MSLRAVTRPAAAGADKAPAVASRASNVHITPCLASRATGLSARQGPRQSHCRRRCRRHDLAARSAGEQAAAAAAPQAQQQGGPVLLWYKRDLRLDDHPGWHQALAQGSPVIPVFCFDPAKYAHLVLPPGGAEALCKALGSLSSTLRQRGSGLLVRVGPWEQVLPGLAAELGAAAILAEEEVDADWHSGVAAVAAAAPGVAVRQWQAPLLASHADDFRELKKQQVGFNPPLDPPTQLPPLAASQISGQDSDSPLQLSASQVRQLAADAYRASLSPQLLPAAEAAVLSAAATSAAAGAGGSGSGSSFSEESVGSGGRLMDRLVPSDSEEPAGSGSSSGSAGWEAELAAEVAAGEGPVLEALGSYLRHLETEAQSGTGSSSGSGVSRDWEGRSHAEAVAEAIAAFDLPATPDGCFPALFGRALSLGVVSRRRIYAEAAQVLQQAPVQPWPAGPNILKQLGWLLTSSGGAVARQRRQRKAAAAAAAAEAKDFHEQMAAGREGRQVHGATLHHWRWRGMLTDYLAAEAAGSGSADPERPAILLCHGFGAFSEHYRDNVAALAAAGYDVYAPTLPGYGRAEKPVLPYGQDVWRDFLAEFVLQVVRRPVVVAGNSIGGFISASMAADYPGLVQGLVLLNSAGLLVEGYKAPSEPPKASPPPAFVVDAVSKALFSFLEGDVARQLRRVYPVHPERADDWLGGEIARAARDPGALGVFRSVFYLPKPRALNYLVTDKFGGPTLVLQGVKDPLNNAGQRADDLARFCPNAQVIRLDAGHCVHDEVPEEVNGLLLKFIEQSVMKAGSGSSSGKEGAAAGTPAAAARAAL